MGDVFESKVSEEEYQRQLEEERSALSRCEENLREARELIMKIKFCGSQFMIMKYIDKYVQDSLKKESGQYSKFGDDEEDREEE
tara:strand:- start:295 stop:546 length:252 start_codon:yes stop_codon:yes gene_type:complete